MRHFLKALLGMPLKPKKRSPFLCRSYQVALGVGGTERYRWLEECFGREPCLSNFASFVHEETTLVNDLIFQRMLYWSMFRILKRNTIRKRNMEVKCSLCEGNHDLDDCNSFLQFDLQKRSKWLFHNKLCYDCLSAISVNHNVRNCKNRKEYNVYKKRHPISLHGYEAEKSKAKQQDGNSSKESKVNLNCATANTKSLISMCVVPVLVRHKLSNYIVKTYAMLDGCSQATFMQNKLLGSLSLHGRKTSITEKTMNGEVTKSSEVLDGIEVAEASNESQERVWYSYLAHTYKRIYWLITEKLQQRKR